MTSAAETRMLDAISERDFMGLLVSYATMRGWATFHVLDSRGSNAGWPDLVVMRPPRILFLELKTEKGRVTDAQRSWIDGMKACDLDARIVRPSDWDALQEALR